MSANTDWDVEKHKLEYECDEHWELRKSFLEAHKDQFPEQQLVCLAQVFTNVELLGCRYPKETMDLVAELSQDVAKDYRERQKSKLQRTFVKASDAASSKIKGLSNAPSHCGNQTKSINTENNRDTIEKNPYKRQRIDNDQPFGNLVLLQYPNSAPQSTIETSARISGLNINWKYENLTNTIRCTIFINNKKLSEAICSTKKIAKAEAAKNGIIELRKYYYLIEVKEDWKTKLNSTPTELNEINESDEKSILENNIGAKLMKLMGWAGGGLGKSQQGIIEPVTVQRQISRRGFGMKLDSNNTNQFKRKCQETLKQYIRDGDTQNPLVFADFSNEERAMMHECARKMGLKSQSHGTKDKRTLLISRRIEPNDLVTELLKVGGTTDKYILKLPGSV
ncbi:hypothetical protein PV327_000071 [Microctonus hyperodae]|uniref:NF-kappa-B-repressing factor n=1 Tax=Microctonus hyperodae TaxID=165561 RepID=A0AA39L1W2_MICHY|nr:hypothetical protein PV327_000071 [Microctonus hyperodae]